jgi:hypothetical protein
MPEVESAFGEPIDKFSKPLKGKLVIFQVYVFDEKLTNLYEGDDDEVLAI